MENLAVFEDKRATVAVDLMKRDILFFVSVSKRMFKRNKLIKQTYFKPFNEQLFRGVETLVS